ncbi:MAG: hypothetical protein ACK526_20045 [Planctomyces sp.]
MHGSIDQHSQHFIPVFALITGRNQRHGDGIDRRRASGEWDDRPKNVADDLGRFAPICWFKAQDPPEASISLIDCLRKPAGRELSQVNSFSFCQSGYRDSTVFKRRDECPGHGSIIVRKCRHDDRIDGMLLRQFGQITDNQIDAPCNPMMLDVN